MLAEISEGIILLILFEVNEQLLGISTLKFHGNKT